MNFYALSALINGIATSALGIFVYAKNRKGIVNRCYGLTTIFIGIWSYSYFFWQISTQEIPALFWCRALMVGAIFIPPTYLHFVFSLLDLYREKKKVLIFYYILGFIFFILNFTPLFIKSVSPKLFFRYWPDAGIAYLPFLFLIYFNCITYAIILMFKEHRRAVGIKREQIKYVIMGAFLGFGGGATNYALWYNIPIPPVGNILVSVGIGIMAYAILKYRLMDINIALTRAGIFVIVYLFVLGIPFVLGYKYGQWQLATWVTVILATAGPFIFMYFQRRAEAILRQEQLQYQQDLRGISSTMMLIKELERLLRTIVLRVVDIVNVGWAGIYLKDEKELKYILKSQRARTGEIHLPKEFYFDSALVKHLYKARLPIIGEEIHSSELKVGLAVPCFIEDNLLGFLLLGDKPKGQLYDQSDVNEFTLLSNQTALAIENCQFYSQERQREHFRRIASLDRQIDCMAHEMDNPIHATLGVLGSIDIALDELKELIPADKMDYLKQKLARVEFNAGRVSKMISAVKEFTKPTTGELSVITLQQIIDSFIAIINPQLHHYGINFTLGLPQEPLWLRANKVEIEQVLVNLGINSVQAIKEAPKENKKEITLKAYPKDISTLRIDFQDTGSGIEEKLLEDIFLDFVTTKASSEGTGLGLSISRKIISRHRGKIWAESEGKGRGAIFHIELPITNDVTEEEKRKFTDEQNEDKKRDLI